MDFGTLLLAIICCIFVILASLTIAAIIFEGIVMLSELIYFGIISLWEMFRKWNK